MRRESWLPIYLVTITISHLSRMDATAYENPHLFYQPFYSQLFRHRQ